MPIDHRMSDVLVRPLADLDRLNLGELLADPPVSHFCQLWGKRLTIVKRSQGTGGVTSSGGDINISESDYPGKWPNVSDAGRKARKYSIQVTTDDRDILFDFLSEANLAPPGARLYPYESDLFAVIALCGGASTPPLLRPTDYKYKAQADIYVQDNLLYGPDHGIDYTVNPDLPLESEAITHEGNATVPCFSLVSLSGDYQPAAAYKYSAGVKIQKLNSAGQLDGEITICDKMMRGDRLLVDGQGNFEHYYSTKFRKPYTEFQKDLMGSTFCNYGDGGSYHYQAWTLSQNGVLLFPFYGPLPGLGYPSLDFHVDFIGAQPEFVYAYEEDLSDLAVQDSTAVQLGWNTLELNGFDGQQFVTFGLRGVSGPVRINQIKATVNRYLSDEGVQSVSPGEQFSLKITDDDLISCHSLGDAQVVFNSGFYF